MDWFLIAFILFGIFLTIYSMRTGVQEDRNSKSIVRQWAKVNHFKITHIQTPHPQKGLQIFQDHPTKGLIILKARIVMEYINGDLYGVEIGLVG